MNELIGESIMKNLKYLISTVLLGSILTTAGYSVPEKGYGFSPQPKSRPIPKNPAPNQSQIRAQDGTAAPATAAPATAAPAGGEAPAAEAPAAAPEKPLWF